MHNWSSEVCQYPQRRADVRKHGHNGLDYIEVSEDHRTLTLYFLNKAPAEIGKNNIQIEGGVRVRDIHVVDIRLCAFDDPAQDDCLLVMVDKPGDYSTYTLRLVELDEAREVTSRPLPGFDPRYTQVKFSFMADVAGDVDCKQPAICAPPQPPAVDINYLAKDYESFRQLILDRLAMTMPDWQESHAPDIGIALVEVLAYTGDYLGYYQDAVATEAYLATARQRISVRRHARLVDYVMHEGCDSGAWLFIKTSADWTSPAPEPGAISFIAGGPANQPEVFQPAVPEPIRLYAAHNEIYFYTWGNRVCCLPAGAESATLQDEWEPADPKAHAPRKRKLHLQPGDVLLFEEISGPNLDPAHRHFVRLTRVEQTVDPLYDQPVVEIGWSAEDALPFALCLSAIDLPPDCTYLPHVAAARGNVILVDHGGSVIGEQLGTVPLLTTPQTCAEPGRAKDIRIEGGDFQPVLTSAPLTFSEPVPRAVAASLLLIQNPRKALPQIWLTSIPPLPDGSGPLFNFSDLDNPARLGKKLVDASDPSFGYLRKHLSPKTLRLLRKADPAGPPLEQVVAELKGVVRHWIPRPDLLHSQGEDFHYVVEIDNDGFAHLRFGDGVCGRRPEAGETFEATYRVGNGRAGNVGAETITTAVVTALGGKVTLTPRNPKAAQGGLAAESIDDVKLYAPGAFKNGLARAVTADDYATLAERNPKVQRAAALLVWTGTRYEARVAIDPLGTEAVDPALLKEIHGYLHRYRRIGHDLAVVPPQYVPLNIALSVNVLPNYVRGHVKSALLDAFSSRVLPGGGRGFFYPDNFSFGDSVYLSRLVATAQTVVGVESVTVTKLERPFAGPNQEIANGVLPIGPLEVARLDNDPARPENGRFRLTLRGGR
jgi:hypothetical protein